MRASPCSYPNFLCAWNSAIPWWTVFMDCLRLASIVGYCWLFHLRTFGTMCFLAKCPSCGFESSCDTLSSVSSSRASQDVEGILQSGIHTLVHSKNLYHALRKLWTVDGAFQCTHLQHILTGYLQNSVGISFPCSPFLFFLLASWPSDVY